MPTVLFLNGFRFFFYSNENDEPAHIHVRKGNGEGKIWLEPSIQIASENEQLFKTKWYEYFGK